MDRDDPDRYPAIADYALIGDCHTSALVSRRGSIDWCCLPRFDSPSVFARLLDHDGGGYCAITPATPAPTDLEVERHYRGESLVLETTFTTPTGSARVLDCLTMRMGGRENPHRQVLRVVEGIEGSVDLRVEVVPRFGYGSTTAWVRRAGDRCWTAIGADQGLRVCGDHELTTDRHALRARTTVTAGERRRLSLEFARPEEIDPHPGRTPDDDELDRRLDTTLDWWTRWSGRARLPGGGDGTTGLMRSAITLKALTHAPTGAIVAAATMALPECLEGGRNWDYRYSWVRDSSWSVRSLHELGYSDVADGFRRFVERSAAGTADDLQVLYGLGGENLLHEFELDHLEGWRGIGPVLVGNDAYDQLQLDAYGELLDLAWRWEQRGHAPDDDYWAFLVELVETVRQRWQEPDRGIWEVRGDPQHFVHSKVMCWVALDRAVRLAEGAEREDRRDDWAETRDEIRAAVEEHGFDRDRGCFVRAYDDPSMDAALLRLPMMRFVPWADERMVHTVDAIRDELLHDGLLLRYQGTDGLSGSEGAFVACTFWLAENLAHQDRRDEARAAFERAEATANDLGLFSEEYEATGHQMIGNFPQALTHLAHLTAGLALRDPAADSAR